MSDFSGKHILIVGGSSGIGKALVQKLTDAGAEVYNASRSESDADGVTNLQLDVTEDFTEIKGLPDKLDGLVYCPGSINLKPFNSLKTNDFLKDFEINVLGAIRCIKAALKSLKSSDSASIVLFSTVAVSQGINFHASIASAKGAVEGLMRSLAAELSSSKIRVNAIAPSLTDTPMAGNLLSSDEKRQASEDRHPLKKIGTPAELASAAYYLLSEDAAWVTGQVMRVDGGLSTLKPL